MRTVAWETSFQVVLRNCSEEARGELGYMEFCNKGQVVGNIRRLLFSH